MGPAGASGQNRVGWCQAIGGSLTIDGVVLQNATGLLLEEGQNRSRENRLIVIGIEWLRNEGWTRHGSFAGVTALNSPVKALRLAERWPNDARSPP